MRTEDGIRSVFYVSNWIIINISNNIFSIMTWIIASNNKLELTLAVSIGANALGVVAHAHNRSGSRNQG